MHFHVDSYPKDTNPSVKKIRIPNPVVYYTLNIPTQSLIGSPILYDLYLICGFWDQDFFEEVPIQILKYSDID